MKLIKNNERLKILYALSDQLWIDLETEQITESEYRTKINTIRREMREEINASFFDMQGIASELGYILTKKQNIFGFLNSFEIVKN